MPALKGAFLKLGAGLLGALPNAVVFQFNPEIITRTPALARMPPPTTGAGSCDASQQPGLPGETMSFSLRLDATDQLTSGSRLAAERGILPALSAIELLMVPASALEIDLFRGTDVPKPFVHPPLKLQTVLFFWGAYRVLPVTLNELSISETQYDQLLNPVRAEVSVTLQVLTPGSDLGLGDDLASGAYKYTQAMKELQAALNTASLAAATGPGGAALSLLL